LTTWKLIGEFVSCVECSRCGVSNRVSFNCMVKEVEHV
jgi:hypothetical protein